MQRMQTSTIDTAHRPETVDIRNIKLQPGRQKLIDRYVTAKVTLSNQIIGVRKFCLLVSCGMRGIVELSSVKLYSQ
jgi:hypothetical protein